MTVVGPPDFIGIGTLLSGAGWWYEQLLEHPSIVPPATGPEGLHFFDRFCMDEMSEDDVAAYHRLFPRRPGELTGEFTSRYLYDAWTLPLLGRAAPDAKLLVILRDPIERYISALAYRLHETDPEGDDAPYMTDAVHRGRYASQLRTLLAFFPREQVLVFQYERFKLEPLEHFRRTVRFLGADPGFVPRRYRRLARGKTGPIPPVRALRALGLPESVNLRRFRRRNGPERPELWPELEVALHDALDEEVLALREELLPELDLSLWPNFAHLRR